MAIQHTSRTGKTYYLHATSTPAGKTKYFFSQNQDGDLVDTIPGGFEIYENVGGQVFLRKIPKQIIRPDELTLVAAALRRHGEAWQYRAEAKKNAITVYEAGDIGGLDALALTYRRRPLSGAEKMRHADYMAVMRFVLEDKKARLFVTERFCFKGGIDDWIHVDGPSELADQVGKYIKHLGQESFFELF